MVEGRPMPPTPHELADLEMLSGMMGGAMDPDLALTLLRRHGGNMDKTASALLEGETADGDQNIYADLPNLEPLDAPMVGPRTPPPSRPENAVIDLTKDDDDKELARALQASLEDRGGPTFGPSNRAPDPNWAMVPSNVEVATTSGMSQDDQAISRAIEASLTYNMSEDTFQELPLEEKIRKGDTPVALRPTSSGLAYAALLVHGLAFIPQFRHTLADWIPLPAEEGTTVIRCPTDGPGRQTWVLVEMMTNMDLAVIGELNVDDGLRDLVAEPLASPTERVGDATSKLYEKIVYAIQNALQYNNCNNLQRGLKRLMMLSHGYHDAPADDLNIDNLCFVKVTVGPTPELNDLVSALAAEFAPPETARLKAVAKRHVIFEPSDIIAFQLVRDNAPPSYDSSTGRKTERATFKYPKSVYLDQFMRESYELANGKRAEQRTLWEEVRELEGRKRELLHYGDKDVLADLRSCLYYYENVAESNGDIVREQAMNVNKEKLMKIIERIQDEAKLIESAIVSKRAEAQSKLDCPELQKHRYDLRAVLIHDGLYGRSHLFSYIKHKGQWWKTLDYNVTMVSEETVLSDATGLHLGAGPYFLLYSQVVSEEDEHARVDWPETLKNSVKHNNITFLRELPEDVAARIVDPNSPPSSPPYIPTTPSEHTISSDVVEPSESRGEPMDTSTD